MYSPCRTPTQGPSETSTGPSSQNVSRRALNAHNSAPRAPMNAATSPQCTATASCAPKPADAASRRAPNSSPRCTEQGDDQNDTSTGFPGSSSCAPEGATKGHGSREAPGGSATVTDAELAHPLRRGDAADHRGSRRSKRTHHSQERRQPAHLSVCVRVQLRSTAG